MLLLLSNHYLIYISITYVIDDYPVVHLQDDEMNKINFPSNYMKTTKYSYYTFIPKFLYNQYKLLTNVYFLLNMVISCIPWISTVTPITAIIPICIVLFVSAIREIVEDMKRHSYDSKFNTTQIVKFKNSIETTILSQDILCGDLIKLGVNSIVPSDIIPIYTSNIDRKIHIETAALNGETSLQQVYIPIEFNEKSVEKLKRIKGELNCEQPNTNIHQFKATLHLSDGTTISLNKNNFIPQGTVIRNTQVVYAFVCYCGKHTKMAMNSTKPTNKQSKLEKLLNQFVISTFLCQLLLCSILTGCSVYSYYHTNINNGYWYLTNSAMNQLTIIPFMFKKFFGYFNLTSYTIPISVGVSLEIVQYIQGLVMDLDSDFFIKEKNSIGQEVDVGMKTNSCSMNGELGTIEYILSDKTGTLTENKMKFTKCCIGNEIFVDVNKGTIKDWIDYNSQKYGSNTPNYDYIKDKAYDFLLCLTLCNSCIVLNGSENNNVEYQSMSPDEIAFCQTSAKNGFELKEKKQDEIEVTINNIMEVFNQVCVVEFSSERKCMSVLIEKEGIFTLYWKGADNVIKRKLNEKSIEEYNQTLIQTDKFSGEGLRTLFIAKKQFEFNYIKDWLKRYNEAKELIYERETQLTALYEELETDLELIGATAIEDQLQEGVPETIQMLREAGIKIWVITGDKMETAISVGLTSRLFTNEHKLIQFNCKTLEEFEEHLKTNISLCQTSSMPIAIAINENNIDWCIKYQSEFSILAKLSESVLCCRVTPIQKANITVWVKKMTNKKCLTVGDGANDVPMINCGDVGVGIYGKEGNQAAVTSDYAIRKFRHLGKLVLYYGRNSMYRNSTLIKLCFYKNAAFFLMDVWFAFISNFSCQILYDDWIMTLYNTFFTALPPIAIALFDFDLRWETIRNDPRCHQETLKSSDYKIRSYISWYFYGVLQSFLFFIIFYFLIAPSDVTSNNGKVNGFTFSVVSVSSYSIISILVTIAIHTRRNCLFIVLSHLFSIILYFGMYTIVMFIPGLSVYNLSRKGWFFTLGQPIFYLTIVLTISLTTFPQIVTIYFNKHIRPRYCNILQEFVTKEKDGYQQFN